VCDNETGKEIPIFSRRFGPKRCQRRSSLSFKPFDQGTPSIGLQDLVQESFVCASRDIYFFVNHREDPGDLSLQQVNGVAIVNILNDQPRQGQRKKVTHINISDVDSFTGILRLLHSGDSMRSGGQPMGPEDVVVEVILELLIAIVDEQLLITDQVRERVMREDRQTYCSQTLQIQICRGWQ
jgi:hypothetical protein